MKQTAMFALALLAGFALGAGAIHGLHAQDQKKAAYLVAEVEVTDPAGYQAYLKKAIETLKPYHARSIARGKPDVKEGAAAPGQHHYRRVPEPGRRREMVQHAALPTADRRAAEGGEDAALFCRRAAAIESRIIGRKPCR